MRLEGAPCLYVRLILSVSRLKESGEQLDDRVVEVHWDSSISHWRMMRFRDDKPHGNHYSVVENIIQSIAEGVEKETVSRFLWSERSSLIYHLRQLSSWHDLSQFEMLGKHDLDNHHSQAVVHRILNNPYPHILNNSHAHLQSLPLPKYSNLSSLPKFGMAL